MYYKFKKIQFLRMHEEKHRGERRSSLIHTGERRSSLIHILDDILSEYTRKEKFNYISGFTY